MCQRKKMKMPIRWHKDCLENTKKYLNGLKAELSRLQETIRYSENEVSIYENQIKLAVAKGRREFDRDRFCIKRNTADLTEAAEIQAGGRDGLEK
jgi:hypothetical protein